MDRRAAALLFGGFLSLLLLACQGAAATPSPTAPPATVAASPAPRVPESPTGPPTVSPTSASATTLVSNDQTTTNPNLVQAPLRVPSGFRFSAHAVALPPGFSISLLAAGLQNPRFMLFDSTGNLLVADQAGSVYRYPAADGAIAATPSPPAPLLAGLFAPSSLAIHDGYLYVGETNRVSRYRYDPEGLPGRAEVVVPNLPTGGHSTRTVVFGPDGKLYVSVGSSCNICDETDERRAAILRFNPDGSGYERFAGGLRNAVGLAFQPGTGLLWATVNERDSQGNDKPPDLVTIVLRGENFGWPNCQPPNATPQEPGRNCSGITPPTVAIQAHAAALGLAFSTGTLFPAEYQGDLFVARHGSWNRQPPTPPMILRIHFAGNRPVSVQNFATGWQLPDESRWGRPAGIIVAPDGSLIVSDDQAGVLYRITYRAGT
ncbi:MAG TPA: PQQ-dependent sugar dehydrogenase [Chloroflexota bacterium]|nr:PQQ-dependent sugar dehydrogenase [Chloroflexota bacterium]